MSDDDDQTLRFFRHALATLAYRAGKSVRGVPLELSTFRPGPTSRTPVEVLAHIGDLLDWALGIVNGAERWRSSPALPWAEEVNRFFASLAALDARLADGAPLQCPPERFFQGPIADAFTHVGQIAMLRRLAGCPMSGENYSLAEIVVGRVGPEQAAPRREFG
jgi:hypothetical protein